MDTKQIRNTLLLALTALVWGSAFVAQSVGAEHVGPFTFLASRSYLGGIVAAGHRHDECPRKHRSGVSLLPKSSGDKSIAAGRHQLQFFLFLQPPHSKSVGATTAAKAGFITSMYVLIVPILTLFMGRKVDKKIWLCVVLGVIGLYLLCMVGGLSLSRGDSMVLLCAFLFSGHILMVDHFSPKMDGVQLSCIQFFVTALLSTICMLLFESPTVADLRLRHYLFCTQVSAPA
ncbi:MAG: DMT family transporter [Ruthenibacterium lactatiformans]|uniref:DMT family transporter n=1 Tax=Ruthenibacterium lactatiformans TaxID=1550024 RepID=UPI00399460EB